MSGEEHLPSLDSLELLIILTRELNADLAGIDEDCFSTMEEDTGRGVAVFRDISATGRCLLAARHSHKSSFQ